MDDFLNNQKKGEQMKELTQQNIIDNALEILFQCGITDDKMLEFLNQKKCGKNNLPFKILGIFRPSDRLEELDKIPRLDNGDIDYWTCARILCEKDGGHLSTMEELAQLASVIYGGEIEPKEEYCNLTVQDEYKDLIPIGYRYWSSEQYPDNTDLAYLRNFNSTSSSYYWNLKSSSNYRAVCVGS